MTIDHCGVYVPSAKANQVNAWYAEALKPLGYGRHHSEPIPAGEVVGYGESIQAMDFWTIAIDDEPNVKLHIAFRAKDRAAVDAFHAAAIKAGGTDNGAPGMRPYAPDYYAAFVHDPIGNNIEVVCRGAAAPAPSADGSAGVRQ
ncbi:Glyoxalase/Bleomycin resistance protein/Dihydroxybiphenyl dioxygenase [Microdochium bolleyi]|uniref:Glyoxalase/Bleomycin resistance protein/Dihydroxybiphenyl dioxygenase n=1 Tax=Microdochium bolleyi TaxID=196109 RepID=A0A136J888_9PEZI|nr:Glyoxalase/Bleomycin resistance protein/Dihydroxybiphenyl dioxygenase [Microdochium bolleyi]